MKFGKAKLTKFVMGIMAAVAVSLACSGVAVASQLEDSAGTLASTSEKKTVRLGYYEDHNFQGGAAEGATKTGYSFEYMQRLSMYTDWEYEYVYGEFSELYDRFCAGEIDLITGLGYKEEREKLMLYPELSMGNTIYSLIKRHDRVDITADPSSFKGLKIGALEGPMKSALEKYLEYNEVDATIVSFADLYDRDDALLNGEVDIVIFESSATSAMKDIQSVGEVGANDYYVCVSNLRPDLLEELNDAQKKMFQAYPELRSELYDKWFRSNAQSAALSDNEILWVEEHPVLKVGYFATYLPYCAVDEEGNVTGIIKDIVPELLSSLNISTVTPEYVPYENYDDMIRALNNEEIDILFPALSEYWTSEQMDIMPTDSVVGAYYNLVYRDDYPDMKGATMAFRETNGLVQAYAMLQYPDAEISLMDSVQDCLDAVAAGKIDATLINGLRTPSYLIYDKKYATLHFSQLAGSVPLGFATRRNESATIEILNHAIGIIDPDFGLNHTHLYEENYKISTLEFLSQNLWIVALPVLIIVVLVLVFVARELKANKLHLIEEETHNKALTDKILEISGLNIALTEETKRAESANRAKTTFLFNMSHDIRTPMNAIMGFRDLLEKHQEEPEKRQDYLKKIEDASNILLSIINNVLEMARIESGMTTVEESVYCSEQFNDSLSSIFDELMEQKDITFTHTVDIEHEYVYCDPVKVREIFANILSNAYKYTNAGGRVSMHLKEIPSDREGWALYRTTVSDTGIGMSKEFLPHVFEEFSRENNTTDAKVEGTGLGMPIVKKLVEILGGTIEVESEKGVGTTFTVTLPHRIAAREDMGVRAGDNLFSTKFDGKRILLAEDNELNAEIAMEILSEMGFEVEHAEDGLRCIEMLNEARAHYYDLILMDIQMPNMNGYEATRKIRLFDDPEKAAIPIVAMTANAFEEDKREARKAGMNAHVAKPIDVSVLMAELARLL